MQMLLLSRYIATYYVTGTVAQYVTMSCVDKIPGNTYLHVILSRTCKANHCL